MISHPTKPRSRSHWFTVFTFLVIAGLALSLAQPASAQTGPGPNPPSPIYKKASKMMLSLDQAMTYTIHLEIPWAASAATADVVDPLPAGLDYVADSADHGGVYDAATRTITWTQVPVTHGTPVELRFDVKDTLAVTAPTPIANQATITLNGNVMQRMAWVMLMPPAPPPLGLEGSFKSASPLRLGAGQVVTYTIHLLDNRTTPVTINVTDVVPPPLTYVDGSADQGGVYDPATHAVTWSNLAATTGQFLLLTFQAKAPDTLPDSHPQMVRNTAAIASAGHEIRRSADILLMPQPPSTLGGSYKTSSQRRVAPGDSFTYSIVLQNSSNTAAPAVVSDPLPEQVSYVADSANAGGVYEPATHTITWSDLSVPEGASLTLTFDVTAVSPAAMPRPVINTAIITSGDITLRRSVWVLILPNPGGDRIPPKVDSLTIGDQDVLTGPDVTLHIAASDNVGVTKMFLKEWVLTTTPRPHWEEVQSSGWIPYQADYAWTLTGQSGAHFVGVWVADAANNRSHLTRRAMDFASLLLPGTHVDLDGMVPYLVYYPAGVDVTATLTTLSGSTRLFVWYPGHPFAPDVTSPAPGAPTETVTFTTPTAGTYLFVVKGVTAADFDLGITPGGGPRPGLVSAAPGAAQGVSMGAAPNLPSSDPAYDPILPQSGVDPLDIAAEPALPSDAFLVFVPVVR